MNVTAIIPARGGSKGVPRKNLREVGGKPLIAWSIEAAQQAEIVDRVIVSTDDDEIRDVAANHGALVVDQPGASDTSKTDDALIYAAQRKEAGTPDLVVLLQPTCPVRAPGLVDECIQRLLQTDAASLFTATRLHFVWHRWKADGTWSTNNWLRPPRQQMPYCDYRWEEDGSVYVVRTEALLRKRCRIVEPLQILEIPRTVDIDTERDLVVAEALLRASNPDGCARCGVPLLEHRASDRCLLFQERERVPA